MDLFMFVCVCVCLVPMGKLGYAMRTLANMYVYMFTKYTHITGNCNTSDNLAKKKKSTVHMWIDTIQYVYRVYFTVLLDFYANCSTITTTRETNEKKKGHSEVSTVWYESIERALKIVYWHTMFVWLSRLSAMPFIIIRFAATIYRK